MFVECIRPFGNLAIGDVTEVPDGASVSEYFFRPCDAPAEQITPPYPPAA